MGESFWRYIYPFIFVGQFILPALKKHEKKYFLRAFTIGGGLFFGWCRALLFFHPEYYAHRNGSVQYLDAFGNDIGEPRIFQFRDYVSCSEWRVSLENSSVVLTLVKTGVFHTNG